MNFVRKCQLALTVSLVLTLALVLSAARLQAASIVGDTVEIWGVAQSNGSENYFDTVQVIDPGVEYSAEIVNNVIYDLNFGPSSISLNTIDDWYSPWFNSGFPPSRLEFRDIQVPGMPGLSIGGVNVIYSDTIVPEPGAPIGYPAFSAGNVTFTSDSVTLITGPYSFPTGSRVLIELVFVPEPGTASLLVCGVLSAVVFVRRRSRRA